MSGAVRLADAALIKAGERYKELKAEAGRIEAEADAIGRQILAAIDVDVRKVDGRLEVTGWKFTSVVGVTTIYPYEAAKEHWRQGVLRRVTRRLVDKAAVAAEIDAGRLSLADANAVAVVTESKPYVRVTPPSKKARAA